MVKVDPLLANQAGERALLYLLVANQEAARIPGRKPGGHRVVRDCRANLAHGVSV